MSAKIERAGVANPPQEAQAAKTVVARQGETIGDLAARHGVDAGELAQANPHVSGMGRLKGGTELRVPEHRLPTPARTAPLAAKWSDAYEAARQPTIFDHTAQSRSRGAGDGGRQAGDLAIGRHGAGSGSRELVFGEAAPALSDAVSLGRAAARGAGRQDRTIVDTASRRGASVSGPDLQAPTAIETHNFTPTDGVAGAYYRKVNSSASSSNTGISATVTLPAFKADDTRWYESQDIQKTGPMDRPSVYLGTHATGEIDGTTVQGEADIGLQWSQRYDSNGNPTFVPRSVQQDGSRPADHQLYHQGEDGKFYNASGEEYKGAEKLVPHFCYIPFARLDEPVIGDDGKLVMEDGEIKKENKYLKLSSKEDQNRYLYPGEKVEMSVERSPGEEGDNVKFKLTREGNTDLEYNIHSNVLGQQDAKVSLKRVTSIDQFTTDEDGQRVGVESTQEKKVLETSATLTGCTWERVNVQTVNGSTPMTGDSFQEVIPGDKSERVDEASTFMTSGFTDAGGETVDIKPTWTPLQ